MMKREQRAAQIWPILTLSATRRQTLTYDLLGRLIGVPRQGLGQLLEPIQSYCILSGLPALTVLVVGETTGSTGEGFIAAQDVPKEQAAVFKHAWLDLQAPTDEQLNDAAIQLPSNGQTLAALKSQSQCDGRPAVA